MTCLLLTGGLYAAEAMIRVLREVVGWKYFPSLVVKQVPLVSIGNTDIY